VGGGGGGNEIDEDLQIRLADNRRWDDFFGRGRDCSTAAMFGRPASPRQHDLHARSNERTGYVLPFPLAPSNPREHDFVVQVSTYTHPIMLWTRV